MDQVAQQIDRRQTDKRFAQRERLKCSTSAESIVR